MSFVFGISHQLPDLQRVVDEHGKQGRFALQQTIRGALYAGRTAEQEAIRSVFDRPTPFIQRSVRVLDQVKAQLRGELFIDDEYFGSQVAPSKVLDAEIGGGARAAKRFEVALRRIGLLRNGEFAVPGTGIPSSAMDGYGNIKGSFIRQLLSYLQAGYSQADRKGSVSNMGAKRIRQLARFRRTEGGSKNVTGVQYFVSFGKLRGGRDSHLHAGIWSRSGIHGVDVKPVIMFVRQPQYRERFDFVKIGMAAIEPEFGAAFDARLAKALETAR